MKITIKQGLFSLFFVSGLCGILYQIVWVRLAYAAFGIITPVLSVVISVFMLGLFLGSWYGGAIIELLEEKTKRSPILFYAFVELGIGAGAFIVPLLFRLSGSFLGLLGETNTFLYL